jgi:hypothetical protein
VTIAWAETDAEAAAVMVIARLLARALGGGVYVVDAPLEVVVGDTEPHGAVEQETDQLTLELFDVVALKGRPCPGTAVADVGVIVTVTGAGELLLQPNSEKQRAAQNKI